MYGGYHAIAIKSDGTIVPWGVNNLYFPDGISQGIDATGGLLHTRVLNRNGYIQVFERPKIIFSQGGSTSNYFNDVVPTNANSAVMGVAAT